MFAMATIDKQLEMDEMKRKKALTKQSKRSNQKPIFHRVLDFIHRFSVALVVSPSELGDLTDADQSQNPSPTGTPDNTTLETIDVKSMPSERSLYTRVPTLFGSLPNKDVHKSGQYVRPGQRATCDDEGNSVTGDDGHVRQPTVVD